MGLVRLILLIALAVLFYRLVRRWLDRRAAARERVQDQGRMLACALCGTYVPEQDAIRDGDKVYCCAAHRDARKET